MVLGMPSSDHLHSQVTIQAVLLKQKRGKYLQPKPIILQKPARGFWTRAMKIRLRQSTKSSLPTYPLHFQAIQDVCMLSMLMIVDPEAAGASSSGPQSGSEPRTTPDAVHSCRQL